MQHQLGVTRPAVEGYVDLGGHPAQIADRAARTRAADEPTVVHAEVYIEHDTADQGRFQTWTWCRPTDPAQLDAHTDTDQETAEIQVDHRYVEGGVQSRPGGVVGSGWWDVGGDPRIDAVGNECAEPGFEGRLIQLSEHRVHGQSGTSRLATGRRQIEVAEASLDDPTGLLMRCRLLREQLVWPGRDVGPAQSFEEAQRVTTEAVAEAVDGETCPRRTDCHDVGDGRGGGGSPDRGRTTGAVRDDDDRVRPIRQQDAEPGGLLTDTPAVRSRDGGRRRRGQPDEPGTAARCRDGAAGVGGFGACAVEGGSGWAVGGPGGFAADVDDGGRGRVEHVADQ